MEINKNIRTMFVLVSTIIIVALAAHAATNMVSSGDTITLTWGTTSPSAGAAVVKSQAKATGGIIGVALNGGGTAGENVSVATKGIFDLSVQASATVGNIEVGDFIYTTVVSSGVCTTVLSNVNTGLLFGQAMEPLVASTSASVFDTINVMIRQPGHL